MVYLKVIFYGLLAFIERHPIFTLFIVLLAIFAPMVLKTIGWIILGVLAVVLLLIGLALFRFHKMRSQMEEQFRSGAGAGFSGAQGFGGAGFSGFSGAQGMTLEELVRKMQEQADARRNAQGGAAQSTTSTSSTSSQQKRVNDKVGDYVDFEEVK
jgi:hypothetical protein